MKTSFSVLTLDIMQLFIPLGIVIGSVLVGYIVRSFLFYRLARWAAKTRSKFDDVLVIALRGPFVLWCFLFGVSMALKVTVLPDGVVPVIQKCLIVLTIVSITLVLANISTRLVTMYSTTLEAALPVTSLTQNIFRIIIIIIGFTMMLNSLGVSITPILASLGVGGLAVALALQDTLSNLFSGFYIIVSKQLRMGEYVKLSSGEEGYVTDINWRTTGIKTLSNTIILVPNAKLTQTIVTNYSLPDRELSISVDLGIDYGSDLEKVEKVTLAVAKDVQAQVPGAVRGFEPNVRFNRFADLKISCSAGLRVQEFTDQHLVTHEFIKRVHAAYKTEGIVIPSLPTRSNPKA